MSDDIYINPVTPHARPSVVLPEDVNDRWLGILACFAIVWGVLGLFGFMFFITSDTRTLALTYNPEQLAYILDTPFWVRACQGMAVLGMLTGSVYLLLRKKSAYQWFMWSLVGTLAVLLDSILRDGFATMGGMDSGINVAVSVVGIFLFWATYSAYQDGQLGVERRERLAAAKLAS